MIDSEFNQYMLDMCITTELAREGMARDIIRQVQGSRKAAGLEMEDRIVLFFRCDDPELIRAVEDHRSYIASECLVAEWANATLGADATFRAPFEIDGKPLGIELRKK